MSLLLVQFEFLSVELGYKPTMCLISISEMEKWVERWNMDNDVSFMSKTNQRCNQMISIHPNSFIIIHYESWIGANCVISKCRFFCVFFYQEMFYPKYDIHEQAFLFTSSILTLGTFPIWISPKNIQPYRCIGTNINEMLWNRSFLKGLGCFGFHCCGRGRECLTRIEITSKEPLFWFGS